MNVQNSNIINAVKAILMDKIAWRVANMLLNRKEATRSDLEPSCGTTYVPNYIKAFRDAGLVIPCEMRNGINRDGKPCRYGVYSLTDTDREILSRAMELPNVGMVA